MSDNLPEFPSRVAGNCNPTPDHEPGPHDPLGDLALKHDDDE
jgi:hypothetical protein